MSIETVEVPPAPIKAPKIKPTHRATPSLFRVIWRWHFYAGLLVSPLLVIVTLTGAIYMFGAEISDVANRELLFVQSTGNVAPYPSMVDEAESAVPGGKATRIVTYADPWRTAAVTVMPPEAEAVAEGPGRDRGLTVFVDPYTATVQGMSQGPKQLEPFFRAVLKIHRQLFAGTTGRIIVEVATAWTIILFLSGVYLWWPRRREKTRGVWVPRWSAKPYALLRDLHAILGIYLLPVCMLIIITGLFYTLMWGESFHYVTKQFFAGPSTATVMDEASQDGSEEDALEDVYVSPGFSLQQAVTKSRSLYSDRDVTVTLPSKSADHYDVSAINDYARGTYGAMNSTGFKLHRDSGDVMDVQHLSNNHRYWWHTWAYPLHVGSVMGLTSKIIWLAACMILIALPVTGLWMWWKRKPEGKSGFPRKPSLEVVPPWVWGAIAILCLLLPAFGLSVILIVAGEWLMHRVRPTAALA